MTHHDEPSEHITLQIPDPHTILSLCLKRDRDAMGSAAVGW
jgi:hypothetical protein